MEDEVGSAPYKITFIKIRLTITITPKAPDAGQKKKPPQKKKPLSH
jgi:hypothetical protein